MTEIATRSDFHFDADYDTAYDADVQAGRFHFASRPNAAVAARAAGVPVLDVVVPVYNEQAALAHSVRRLHRYLRENFAMPTRIRTPHFPKACGHRRHSRPAGGTSH